MNRSLAGYSSWGHKGLDKTEVTSVNPKGNQSWIVIGRTDAEAPILWPPDVKSWFIGKDPDARKDWGKEEKEVTEDGMVEWHDRLHGCEFHKLRETVKDREPDMLQAMELKNVRYDLAIE